MPRTGSFRRFVPGRRAGCSSGQVDTVEVVKTLKELDFDGFMITDHVPRVVGDSPWGHRSRAHAVGFMQALVQAVDKLCG